MNQEEELNLKHHIWSGLLNGWLFWCCRMAMEEQPWQQFSGVRGAFAWRSRTGDEAMRTSSFDDGWRRRDKVGFKLSADGRVSFSNSLLPYEFVYALED